MLSSVSLAFKSGSFVINLKNVGFSILSSIEKGVSFCVNGVTNTVNSVGELRKLKKEYDELVIKLEKFEQMQRSNVDIRKENERLKEQLDFVSSIEEKNILTKMFEDNEINIVLKVGANILLEDFSKAAKLFDSLDDKQKISIMNFPIANLWKQNFPRHESK